MIVALVDNGSLEPAAHRGLRAVATALGTRTGVPVHAVSWKHSDRLRLALLDHQPAWTLAPWIRAQVQAGEREFLLVPFFVSPQGAIGSALRSDLEKLQRELGGFAFTFTPSLAESNALAAIVADRIRATIASHGLHQPSVIVVDHGGPSEASARLRDAIAASVAETLGAEIRALAAASLEGAEHPHNHPLLTDQLAAPGFDRGDVVVAPLFLAPGRHAGPHGDLAQIADAAADRRVTPPLRCHFTELIGTHPLTLDALSAALRTALSQFPAEISA